MKLLTGEEIAEFKNDQPVGDPFYCGEFWYQNRERVFATLDGAARLREMVEAARSLLVVCGRVAHTRMGDDTLDLVEAEKTFRQMLAEYDADNLDWSTLSRPDASAPSS